MDYPPHLNWLGLGGTFTIAGNRHGLGRESWRLVKKAAFYILFEGYDVTESCHDVHEEFEQFKSDDDEPGNSCPSSLMSAAEALQQPPTMKDLKTPWSRVVRTILASSLAQGP